jgi:hypothetical protein
MRRDLRERGGECQGGEVETWSWSLPGSGHEGMARQSMRGPKARIDSETCETIRRATIPERPEAEGVKGERC